MMIRQGSAELGVLAVICLLLTTVFFFQEFRLTQFRQHLAQQQGYFALDYTLNTQDRRTLETQCATSPVAVKPHFKLSWQADNAYATLRQSVVCVYLPYLDLTTLKQAHLTTLETLIPKRHWQQLGEKFMPNPDSLAKKVHIWWLKDGEQWQVDEDIYGVVFAQANSRISGTGKVHGVVISQGKISVDVAVELNPSVVKHALDANGFWQIQAESWHDFSAL
ncbi:DUF2572 family protein [Spirabiliibacterium falconis]|uniref:DUF2572 family protein n=1 Tax=Spirabiliibacterium falconis TaxID=572023 RepID=UPI001AADE102|nr:DUF2572 family protein [Spirabiliibacterium falconis]MBE2893844.1 DUF2572 family protein [Spirabiliibacterium falconis]